MKEWDRQVFIAETGIYRVGKGSEAVSHCEWRPITDACKADSIHVWDGYELVKAYWTRYDFTHPYSWCTVEADQYGEACYTIEPQPKYYLAVTPPPEE